MKICNEAFDLETDQLIAIFNQWPFTLSDFQKFAICAILNKYNVIITAHTGSGKTLPADFAISHFTNLNKKIIYTTPVKALTNQKYNTFKTKYPDISFGIITGDITYNPDAQVLFVTTEILRNTLFKKQWLDAAQNDVSIAENQNISLDINITPEDLGAVVFDEIHYIMDKDRGSVWHESIMMLPNNVQIIGLSATIDKPEELAQWIETIKKREIWLCPTNKRVIPLYHYGFITFPPSVLDKMSADKLVEFENLRESKLLLKSPDICFQDIMYHRINKLLKYLRDNNIWIDRFFVINQLIRYLNTRDYLPAICFVYSRKQVEQYANKITCCLFKDGSKIPSIIEKECKQLLIGKVANYKEYINLPEYNQLIKLFQKGIAIHHAGMIQIFREMTEHLFEKGYIKLLFATETFAVGIDMPAKSVIFTALQKYNGHKFRFLEPYEYAQQSGRAGRRGQQDKKGRVWHLINLFDLKNAIPNVTAYSKMLEGRPQPFASTFKIHYNLLLRLLSMKDYNMTKFIEGSLMSNSIQHERSQVVNEIKTLTVTLNSKKTKVLQTSIDALQRYGEIVLSNVKISQKKRKKLQREQTLLKQSSKTFLSDYNQLKSQKRIEVKLKNLQQNVDNIDNYIQREIDLHIKILVNTGFVADNQLTSKGIIAANLQEIHCLAMADILEEHLFDNVCISELASVLSIFTSVSVKDADKVVNILHILAPENVKTLVTKIQSAYHKYYDIESVNRTGFANDYNIHYNMCELIYQWCEAPDEFVCAKVFRDALGFNISRGEFIKAILKINNVANELIKVAEIQSNMALLDKMKKIPDVTLKYIATNQSLYL